MEDSTMAFNSGSSSSRSQATQTDGIPRRCWCGEKVVIYTSKTEDNPYRRFYRCVMGKKMKKEDHLFKWVDEAVVEEINQLNSKHEKLLEDFTEMTKRVTDILQTVERQKEVMKKMEDRAGSIKLFRNLGIAVIVVGSMAWVCQKFA